MARVVSTFLFIPAAAVTSSAQATIPMHSSNRPRNSEPDPDPKPPNSRPSRRRAKAPRPSAHAQSPKNPRKHAVKATASRSSGLKQHAQQKSSADSRRRSSPSPSNQEQFPSSRNARAIKFFNDPILDEFIACSGQENPDINHIPSPYLNKRLREFAVSLAGFEASNNGSIELLAHLIKRFIMDEIIRERFVTNDLVTIRGSFARFGTHLLTVNGSMSTLTAVNSSS